MSNGDVLVVPENASLYANNRYFNAAEWYKMQTHAYGYTKQFSAQMSIYILFQVTVVWAQWKVWYLTQVLQDGRFNSRRQVRAICSPCCIVVFPVCSLHYGEWWRPSGEDWVSRSAKCFLPVIACRTWWITQANAWACYHKMDVIGDITNFSAIYSACIISFTRAMEACLVSWCAKKSAPPNSYVRLINITEDL